MNTDLIEPVLMELLQLGRETKAEQAEQRKLLQRLLEKNANTLEAAALKEWFKAEMEKLQREMGRSLPPERKSWTLFSNDFQAQNFKVVVETICKWIAIICGSFYLLWSVFSLWKR